MENLTEDLPIETTLSNYLKIPSASGGVEVNVLKSIEVLHEKQNLICKKLIVTPRYVIINNLQKSIVIRQFKS